MRMSFPRVKILLLLLLSLGSILATAQQNNTTKPWVFWYWIQGGVSKEGITADLQAMKEAGIGGAYLMSIQGPAKVPLYTPVSNQLTPRWWSMVTFAMAEAKRLELKIGMHVSDGFALAGGPWITPELSMQKVVHSKINIKGAGQTKFNLPQPETLEGYYKDIAVYAYPSPTGSGISTQTQIPKITTSNGTDASGLVKKGNTINFGAAEPLWIQYEFAQPFTCRTITVKTNGNNYQAERLALEISDDGKNFRSIGRLEAPRHGWQDTDADVTHAIVPATARYFRFLYDKSGSEPGAEDLDAAKWKPSLKLVNLELSAEAKINQFEGKSGMVWRVSKRSTTEDIATSLCVPLDKIINLTGKLNPDGSLNWKAPAGNWTILRVGHTSTGHKNATGGAGMGLEADKFNPEAVKLQFSNWYGEAIKQAGPALAKEVLSIFHVDSWECGSQNWSPLFRAEFLKRRGYDLTPYLPIMTGLPVQSAAVSEAFLYDVRKTIAELVVDQFYKTLATLAKANGVTFTAESVAPTMLSDGLMHYKMVDIPMGEYWLNSPTHDKPNDMLDAISAAHIYGKNIIQAEAFTTVRMDWNEHPGNMKTLQDRNYALGINKLVYHVYTHNPWIDKKPGMTLDGVGLYFQRDQTWWKPGKAWVDYAERSQVLLQKGTPVADIAVFIGEELPRRSILPDRLVKLLPGIFGADVVEAEEKRLANIGTPLRQIPAGVNHSANMADAENWVNPLRGYAYDSFNPDVLSTAKVVDGKVVFLSGATYKILVIPGYHPLNPNYKWMSAEVLKKLLSLVKMGATILVSAPPTAQPGLDGAISPKEFHGLVSELYAGNQEVKKLGKGRVLKGPYQAETFENIGLSRDLIVADASGQYARKIAYHHRSAVDQEIYFISNQEDKERVLSFSFRVGDKIPELYDAVKDERIKVEAWKVVGGRTELDLKLSSNASIFVIFKKPAATTQQQKYAGNNWHTFKVVQNVTGPWMVSFDPSFAGPAKPILFEELTDWTNSTDSLVKYYSGTAVYQTTFKYNGKPDQKVWLNLTDVANIADVKVNGIPCGIVWTAPFQVDISKALRKGTNQLTIEVTNTWANRLIGDQKLPVNKRITHTTAPFRLEGKPLHPAGLLGKVQLLTLEENL
ncbi:glycosyl hydrolase [Pedobacter immunditicola]|uniref:glycosyl hydrolase n=1 Tax=Pedobacter immunditicola TaxID=3133440 RepID=UPI0030B2B3B9